MKKKLLVVALAGVIAAPMAANAGLYASIRADLEFVDTGGNSDTQIGDHSSRLGIKNALDLGNGLKAVGRFEWNADANGTNAIYNGRLGYVGLAGSFGEVQIGQLWGASYFAAGGWDIMNATGYTTGSFPIFRITGVAYEKGFGPVNFRGALQLEPEVRVGPTAGAFAETVDAVDLGFVYSGPVNVGLGWVTNNNTDFDHIMISVGGGTGAISGVIGYSDTDQLQIGQPAGGLEVGSALQLALTWTAGNNSVYGLYEDSSDIDVKSIALGVKHKFNSQVFVAAEIENVDVGLPNDNSGLHLFLRYDFD